MGALSLLLTAGNAMAAQPLKVGYAAEPYPPFTYKTSSGEWTGFEVELANAVCEEIGRECNRRATAWSGIIPALKSNKIDMIFNSMSITEERDKVVDFTNPYYKTGGAYVAREDMGIEFPQGLKGKTLGVQSSTTHSNYARDALSDMGIELKFYNKQEQANRDLRNRRIDATLADQIAMAEFVDRDNAADLEIKATTPEHPAYGEGIGIAVRESDNELRTQLNKALAAVIENGTCKRLSQEYFDQNICTST
jgi:polar amino acid transport system substrate-binding protein